ncbi:MAG TPA: hypothetical protein VHZ07_24460 [Bryobacteraceae bacterium]|jgi:hypothetical protein|nr:hypothetical protein [Bryobacteraceae bacterium]
MRLFHASVTVFLVAAVSVFAQGQKTEGKGLEATEMTGMPPRATAGDYPSQARAGDVTIAAEFMGHSVPKPEGPLSTEDYVVVEAGFFGSAGGRIKLSTEDFSLRINGKKPLASQPYGLVLSSLKDPQWSPPVPAESKSKTGLSTGGGGDSTPAIVHVPFPLQRAMAMYVQKVALLEGDRPLPQAGLIFFQYRGKTQNIHSLELIYSGSAGKTGLKLQP